LSRNAAASAASAAPTRVAQARARAVDRRQPEIKYRLIFILPRSLGFRRCCAARISQPTVINARQLQAGLAIMCVPPRHCLR
jgi:hypothetical protein